MLDERYMYVHVRSFRQWYKLDFEVGHTERKKNFAVSGRFSYASSQIFMYMCTVRNVHVGIYCRVLWSLNWLAILSCLCTCI